MPDILTTLHVLVVMSMVELLIRSVPLPRLSKVFGTRLDLEPGDPAAQRMRMKDLSDQARRQVNCTRRVAHVWPFADGPCLRSALVTGHLLRDLDPSIRLGLLATEQELYAHAWVEIDGRPLEHVAGFDVFSEQSHTGDEVDLSTPASIEALQASSEVLD